LGLRRPSRHLAAAAEGNDFTTGRRKPFGVVFANAAGTGDSDA